MRAALIAIAVALGSGLMSSRSARAAGDPASAFLDKINALRASKGIAPLQMNAALSSFAAAWTTHMLQTNTLAHNPALGSAPNDWTVVGENVGDGASVDDIFNGFVASPHHYANIVDPRFNIVGISVQVDSAGRVWTTHDFEKVASLATAPAPAPAAPAPAPRVAPKASAPRPAAPPAPVAPVEPAPAPAPAPAPDPVVAAPPAPVAPPAVPSRMKFSLEGLRGDQPAF